MAHRSFSVLAIVGLFISFLASGCARTIMREELQTGLAPLNAQTSEIQGRLAALEGKQTRLEGALAGGFDIVGKSLRALDIQTSDLRQQVEGMEKTTATQFQKLGSHVEAAKKVAAMAGKNALAAQKTAEQADLNAQLGAADLGAQLDAEELRAIRRVGATEETRVSDEKETREVVSTDIRTESGTIQDVIKVNGNATRDAVKEDGDKTRLDLATKVDDVRTENENRAKKILEELEKLKPATPVPPTTPATP